MKIVYQKQAEKELRRMDKSYAIKIIKALELIASGKSDDLDIKNCRDVTDIV